MRTETGVPRTKIAVEDVRKGFATDDGTLAVVDGVSFTVGEGEVVALVGPSGCGKSTILNLIAGFDRPDSGAVRIDGALRTKPNRKGVLISQHGSVFPWLTVRENLMFGLDGTARAEKEARADRYAAMVGLTGFERSYPRELSGGMLKRVEVARALAVQPEILFMDEPFSALDALLSLRMRNEVLRILAEEPLTVVLITHDVEEAIHIADRVLVLSPRPARIQATFEVTLPHPRNVAGPEAQALRVAILRELGVDLPGLETAEAPAPAPAARVGAAPAASAGGALDTDVVIVGGGPAGAILGAYLARAGVDHLILDKAVHPRPHVGESLLCATTRVFREIDFLDALETGDYVRKHGALWTHHAEAAPIALPFQAIPRLGIEQPWSWHVDRSRFDDALLRHAAAQGSRVEEGVQVERVELDETGRAIGVIVREGEARRLLRARLVVDATGRGTLLGSQLHMKRNDPAFRQFAVHGWFEGVDRGAAATAEWIHVHVLPGPRAWAWQIPISAGATSVGVVCDADRFPKAGDDPATFFAEAVASSAPLARAMAGARPLHALQREGNYSYAMERLTGDGWLLVGDAARFVDPLFSSGLSVAAESAREAATAIREALARGDFSAAAFASYEDRLRGGLDAWREFISLYYRSPRAFLGLLADPAEREQLRDVLQGDLYEPTRRRGVERLRAEIARLESDPSHPWLEA
jgi:ABC-type nitrate/sulfonate/bicarbonate transport system ATPase subunit/flavin-dependent dehydrogenase